MAELNNATVEEFESKLSGIFEKSPWIVEAIVGKRPFRSGEQMMAAMMDG
jgi:2-oxo-4-hydroxy-4-carboxy--5-ureidoimidazoline (OHCU) decarboxylase